MNKGVGAITLALLLTVWLQDASADGPVVGPNSELAWDAVTDPDLAGYRLYTRPNQTVTPALQMNDIIVTQVPFSTAGITAAGQYYATVTAFDTAGNESSKSNEVAFVLDPAAPTTPLNLRVVITFTLP